ncbi:MAG: hypothetical protein KDJ41_03790 [Hyphomicrobiaceae bacterium]|nr:hypothetical protein [Hyphomicrobiaceae bacterium]
MISIPRHLLLLTCLGALALAGAAAPRAEEAGKAPDGALSALAAFLARNADCVDFNDGCMVCARLEQGGLSCSTPGIACQPGKWTCVSRRPREADQQGKRDAKK